MKVANLMMVHLDSSFDWLSLSGVIVKFSHFIHLSLNFGIRIRRWRFKLMIFLNPLANYCSLELVCV
jgi:hypothetical protein